MKHRVEKGQTVSAIARRYHTTVAAIAKRNALKRRKALRIGQVLRVKETKEHRRWSQAQKGGEPRRHNATRAKKTTPASHRHAKGPRVKGHRPAVLKPGDERVPRKNALARHRARWKEHVRTAKRPGRVRVVRHREIFRGRLRDRRGRVIEASAKRLDTLLRSLRKRVKRKMSRELLRLLGGASDYFGGKTIVLVSGYRPYSPKQHTRNSRHNHGRAVDFHIVGVPNRALYEYCLTLPRVGCGYYPNSLFIHMDVRRTKTQWTDISRPGKAPIYRRHKRKKRRAHAARQKKRNSAHH